MAEGLTEIILKIKDCQECPFFKSQKVYTGDSFENGYDWLCGKKKDKKIAGFVEWNDPSPKVPDWCPIKVKS